MEEKGWSRQKRAWPWPSYLKTAVPPQPLIPKLCKIHIEKASAWWLIQELLWQILLLHSQWSQSVLFYVLFQLAHYLALGCSGCCVKFFFLGGGVIFWLSFVGRHGLRKGTVGSEGLASTAATLLPLRTPASDTIKQEETISIVEGMERQKPLTFHSTESILKKATMTFAIASHLVGSVSLKQ